MPKRTTSGSVKDASIQKLIKTSSRSRQPVRQPWSLEKLDRERTATLDAAQYRRPDIAYSTYTQSYIDFCELHDFPITPTEDTLSFYVVYMCHYINPESVDSEYLADICTSLEPYYPNIWANRRSVLVSRTLAGCKKMANIARNCRRPLNDEDLHILLQHHGSPAASHDDKLFLAIVFIGFHTLTRLSELVHPDGPKLHSWRGVILRESVNTSSTNISFLLPSNNSFPEGHTITIEKRDDEIDPVKIFQSYLTSRDAAFQSRPGLWLCSDGSSPTCTWVRNRLSSHFAIDIAGQSLRYGGAVRLAKLGVPDDEIQAAGRWTPEAFQKYVRQHPDLLRALVYQDGAHAEPVHHPYSRLQNDSRCGV